MRRIRIDLIRSIARGWWPIDPKRVRAYRQMLREGKRPPPIDLGDRLPDGRWKLLDGRHRLKTAKLKGARTIEVRHVITEG